MLHNYSVEIYKNKQTNKTIIITFIYLRSRHDKNDNRNDNKYYNRADLKYSLYSLRSCMCLHEHCLHISLKLKQTINIATFNMILTTRTSKIGDIYMKS